MSKRKILKNTIITMLVIVMAMMPTLSGYQENVMAAVNKSETTESVSGSVITTSGSAVTTNGKVYLDVLGSEFTIRSSSGSYAKVKGIEVEEGNLEVKFSSIEIGGSTKTFEIPELKEDESYTVDFEKGTKEICIRNTNKNNGFYCLVKAEKPVSITVDCEGVMSTHTKDEEAVCQCQKYT